jgi:NDP-sugar pyrophosphorylase family protein
LATFVLSDGRTITAGTLGGTIDSPKNLAQAGACWVLANAQVRHNAYASGDSISQGNSVVSENAKVYGEAIIDNGTVRGRARVLGSAFVQSSTAYTYGSLGYKRIAILW